MESPAAPSSRIRLPDGRSLGYAEYGDRSGTPVFFFHGTPSSRLLHPDDSVSASVGARVITVDRPGHFLLFNRWAEILGALIR